MSGISVKNSTTTCPECEYDLSAHVAEAGDEPFRCPECGESTTRSELDKFRLDEIDKLRAGPIWWLLTLAPAAISLLDERVIAENYRNTWTQGAVDLLQYATAPYLLILCYAATRKFRSRFDCIVSTICIFILLLVLNVLLMGAVKSG